MQDSWILEGMEGPSIFLWQPIPVIIKMLHNRSCELMKKRADLGV